MAKYKIPYQDLEFEIPDAGQVFVNRSSGMENIFKREGNNLIALNLEQLGKELFKPSSDRPTYDRVSANERLELGKQVLKNKYGVDYDSVPKQDYKDLFAVFGQISGFGFGQGQPSAFQQGPITKGEVITQNVSGVNAQGTDVESNLQGTISKAKSLEETLREAGANQDQIDYLVKAEKTGKPLTPEDIQAIGLSPQQADAVLQGQGASGTQSGTQGGQASGVGGTPQTNEELEGYLNSLNLPDDLKAMVRTAYDAISTNDVAKANKLMDAFNAATEFSDPYFKAQISLATDALARGIQDKEGDLAFKEQQLNDRLNDLKENVAASKDYNSFQQNQELQQLLQNHEQELDTTRNDLASRGFTSSSIRSNKEKILSDDYNNMVESSNRKFSYQTGVQDRQLASESRDTQQQIDYYRQLNQRAKTDLLRNAEETVGSGTLKEMGYTNLLGNQGGKIKENQVKDALGFASNY